jgi:hypothetical protein
LAREGKIIMTLCTTDVKQVAEDLLSNSKQALQIYDHYDQTLTPREAAQFRGSLLFYIYRHAKGTYEVARAIALEAWLKRDWEYILDSSEINPNNMIQTFRRLLEHILPEDGSAEQDAMRGRWINHLGVEIPVLRGPLMIDPIDPARRSDKAIINEVRTILQEAEDTKGILRLDDLLKSGDLIDQSIFDQPNSTASAREIVSDLRYLKNTPTDRKSRKKLALLAYAGKQTTIRDYRNKTGAVNARTPRYKVVPELISEVDVKTGELIEQYYVVSFRFKEDQLLKWLEDRCTPIFKLSAVKSSTKRVVRP